MAKLLRCPPLRRPQCSRSPLCRYACCRQGARIQTYAVIIAITLNTIRYSMSYLISSWALKSEAPVPLWQCAGHSLNTDDPSGRSCSRRQLRARVGHCQPAPFPTAVLVPWLRRVTEELFSLIAPFLGIACGYA